MLYDVSIMDSGGGVFYRSYGVQPYQAHEAMKGFLELTQNATDGEVWILVVKVVQRSRDQKGVR
jgi:hypothetical protein